ncbi:hypothetical protein MVES1_001119 [Malassezia vespertilionis]|uniref:uncharacterized protein n=1 Tax=Malassezia vespertilionis TaxID=2020962 RepID=UPI0024B105E7|nr:uncharacterized protein MVES1_001119 [Malassezia vespertilionis]WFD05785.1 hypothetical protein MVES1_001119 [Malassezia vespertilionis]
MSFDQLLVPPSPGDEPPRVMELYEVLRALKWAQRDERVRGIVADFSALHVPPTVAPQRLGLAQMEEILQALHEFHAAKHEQFGADHTASIAWTDTFDNQGAYLLASGFDRVYMQPSGQVPLVGLSSQIPFFKRLLHWAGIRVHAEAREEYKSMVSPFIQETLPPAQLAEHSKLLGELNRGYAYAVGVSRFANLAPCEATDRVAALAHNGPFTAKEAKDNGLIDDICYKRDILKQLLTPEELELEKTGGNALRRFKTLMHYAQTSDDTFARTLSKDEVVRVGVVYLLGGISNASGPFSVSAAIQGLKEAVQDPEIKTIVLRIDSGGGDVVASETLWDAVRRVRSEFGKPVIASFGNTAASGAYYVATATDTIFAGENTVTGSIGVAALRPTITHALLDRLQLNVQGFFTGSSAQSTLQDLDADQLAHMKKSIDATYADFLDKVKQGRALSNDVLREVAGGRVMTGLTAWTQCAIGAAQSGAPGAALSAQGTTLQDAAALLSQWRTESKTGTSGNDAIYVERQGPFTNVHSLQDAAQEAQDAAIQADLARISHQTSPYGRGLIDAIGGLWDAAMHATNLTLQMEAKALQEQHQVSEEEAMAMLRPKCGRADNPTHAHALTADVRLVRFPADVPFWQRIQQFGIPREPNLGTLLRSLVALWTFWMPSGGLGMDASLLRELENVGGTKLKAEYPFGTQFV